jgi:hypothetical protein
MPGDNPLRAGSAVSGGHMVTAAGMPRRFGRLAMFGGAASLLALVPGTAAAADQAAAFTTVDVIQLAVLLGVLSAALLSAIALIRERARIAAENVELRGRVADLGAALQRSESLLNLRDQRVVVWSADNRKP